MSCAKWEWGKHNHCASSLLLPEVSGFAMPRTHVMCYGTTCLKWDKLVMNANS